MSRARAAVGDRHLLQRRQQTQQQQQLTQDGKPTGPALGAGGSPAARRQKEGEKVPPPTPRAAPLSPGRLLAERRLLPPPSRVLLWMRASTARRQYIYRVLTQTLEQGFLASGRRLHFPRRSLALAPQAGWHHPLPQASRHLLLTESSGGSARGHGALCADLARCRRSGTLPPDCGTARYAGVM